MKFYKCDTCGQIVALVDNKNNPIKCCGANMKEIIPLVDESNLKEKHVPMFSVQNNKVFVKVGKILHPSTKDHYIEWIFLKTNKGNQRKVLNPNDEPVVSFCLDDGEQVEAIYAYCNLHSLWILDVRDSECKKGDKN